MSLECIGDRHKNVVAALSRTAGKEKNRVIANHMCSALGRCGVGDSKARSILLKKCAGTKSEFASYGPTIGLAYFEGEKKAARGVGKILKKIGVPGGRRGGGLYAEGRLLARPRPGLVGSTTERAESHPAHSLSSVPVLNLG
ncbi:MAG: hypothetical protein ACYSX0_06050 [Planctomycetota bacterium]